MKIKFVNGKSVARAAGVVLVSGALLSVMGCDGKQEDLGKKVDEAAGDVQEAREEISEGKQDLVQAQKELERAKEEAEAALATSSPLPEMTPMPTPEVSPELGAEPAATPAMTPVDLGADSTPVGDFPPAPEASPVGGVVEP